MTKHRPATASAAHGASRNDHFQMTLADKIRAAPNAKAANAALPEGAAIIYQGKKLWAFSVNGQAQTSQTTFDDAKSAAARFYETPDHHDMPEDF